MTEASDGSATLRFTVGEEDTAVAVGSGALPVLGTPRLLAWCEAATCAAVDPVLDEGRTSVGTRVDLEHLAASPVGHVVEVTARTVYADGRLRRFAVAARHRAAHDPEDAPGKLVASGEVTRVVVDTERFLGRLR
ncbi:thioesterase family protein [Nocardioides sambongensis]|uniref:thioesterase family protein n=1 Tax=Nocardioides sambongensis TaxID=2589074 RepID=UPI00112B128E|nr:thioesterase [Nocardioides sambongensis]